MRKYIENKKREKLKAVNTDFMNGVDVDGMFSSEGVEVEPIRKGWDTFKSSWVTRACYGAAIFSAYTYYDLGGFAQFLEFKLEDIKIFAALAGIGWTANYIKRSRTNLRMCACGCTDFTEVKIDSEIIDETPRTLSGRRDRRYNYSYFQVDTHRFYCNKCGGYHDDQKVY